MLKRFKGTNRTAEIEGTCGQGENGRAGGLRRGGVGGRLQYKLQALVYDSLPSTTAVFSYVIGSRKLSANEQFFVGAQTVVVTSNSDYIRRLFYN